MEKTFSFHELVCVQMCTQNVQIVATCGEIQEPTRVRAAQLFLERQGGGRRTLVYSTGELGSGWQGGRLGYRYGFGQSKQAASALLLTESEWVKHEQIILNLLVINQLI